MSMWRSLATLCVVLALAACGRAPVLPQDAGRLKAQSEREQRLAADAEFHVSGRIAVSRDGDGGSGSFDWQQLGRDFDFSVRSQVARQSWRMVFRNGLARLEGVDGGSREGSQPERLLAEELGWTVPVQALAFWARGARAPGAGAELWFDADGRPARLRQFGWQVDYRDWHADDDLPLPRRVFAERDDARVRLLLERWTQP